MKTRIKGEISIKQENKLAQSVSAGWQQGQSNTWDRSHTRNQQGNQQIIVGGEGASKKEMEDREAFQGVREEISEEQVLVTLETKLKKRKLAFE